MIKMSTIHSSYNKLINQEFNYAFGSPGSGKSTLLAAVSECAYSYGIPCFSNFPMKHTYKFLGFDAEYPVGSIFCLDEIYDLIGSGINRGLLPPDVSMFFKTFRHSRYTIWACSQEADDCARRIRGVVTQAWVMSARGHISTCEMANIREVKSSSGERYDLEADTNLIPALLGRIILYRPDFYDIFDSYCRSEYKSKAKLTTWK